MKRMFVLLTGIIWMMSVVYFQSITFAENLDYNSCTFTLSLDSAWMSGANYYVSSSNAIRGTISNMTENSIGLATPAFIRSSSVRKKDADSIDQYIIHYYSRKSKYSNNASVGQEDVLFRRQSGGYGNFIYTTVGFKPYSTAFFFLTSTLSLPLFYNRIEIKCL
jgi:hypothetical protein